MKTLEILTEAKRILEKPESWIRGTGARDTDGLRCHPIDDKAFCFCLAGALFSATVKVNNMTRKEASWRVIPKEIPKTVFEITGTSIVCWNDNPERKHSEVLELLDKLIEKVKKNGS